MATYTQLTDDEKSQVKIAAKRNLEYQMYVLEVDLLIENAKDEPDANVTSEIQTKIAEKQAQIAAI